MGKTGIAQELGAVGVLPEFGGKGIGGELTRLSIQKAKDMGYWMSKAECTSAFSTKAICKAGGKIEKTVEYKDYEEKGKKIFEGKVIEPHTCANLVVIRHRPEEDYKLD